jgi:hypothetical protein
MADWNTYLAGLLGNNPGLLAGLTGDTSGLLGPSGILGSLNATNTGGILSAASPSAATQAPGSQSVLGPSNVGQPQTISPQFAQSDMARDLPQINPSAAMWQPPQLQGQNQAPPADNSGSFWSRNNPDGTQDIFGGLLKYDPAKDLGQGNRMGMIGATFADMGANIGGHPEAAKNLALFTENQKKLAGQKALSDLMTGIGGPAPAPTAPMQPPPRLADQAAAQLPQLPPSGYGTPQSPAPMGGAVTVPPSPAVQQANASTIANAIGTSLPQLPPPQSGSQFNLRTLGPKLAALAANGTDITPIVSMLKDLQPKYGTDVHWTADNKPYLSSDSGEVRWLDPSVTPRDKMEVAGNGTAYNPYAVQAGADFSDRSKPFDSTNGQSNVPVQRFEMGKATAPAIIRANADYARMNQENLQPPVQIGFTGPDGEEKQVAASWNRKVGKYVDVSNGQPITSTPNLRVIGNATGGGRSMAMAGRVSTAALDAATDIQNLSGIGTGAGMGLFANVTTTPLSALSRTLTPQQVQDTQTTMAGLSRAMSLLGSGGMQGSDTVMKSFDLLQPNTGDSMLTTMRKLGSFRQQAGNGIDAALASPMYSPAQKKQLQEAKAKIDASVPWTPHDVQMLENGGQSGTSMRDVFSAKLAKSAPPNVASPPRIAQPPSGTISGVKWKLVSPGAQ